MDARWDGIETGAMDMIATDHVAHARAKRRDAIWDVTPGFSGTVTMSSAVWTHGVEARRITPARFVELLSWNRAAAFGLTDPGPIAPGMQADLALIDPAEERIVDAAQLGCASDYSTYGQRLRWSETVVVRHGAAAMDDGRVVAPPGSGSYARREPVAVQRARHLGCA